MRLTSGILTALVPAAVLAQTGSLVGTVTSDSLRTMALKGADVSITAVNLSARTNVRGKYRFADLQPGRYLVTVRAIGYKRVGDTVVVVDGREAIRNFVLSKQVSVLDTVVTLAKFDSSRLISPQLRAFEERQKAGFGHFIGEETLRKNDGERLASIITQRIPGVALSRATNVLVSTRAGCAVSVYVDGVVFYNRRMTPMPPPDMYTFNVSDLGGVEFYASAATYPPWISPTYNECGVLLIWTRER